MTLADRLDALHVRVKQNRWLRYFTVFNRVALAAGFFPAGFVKVTGERFTDLSNNHPLGQYLEALFHTGYYYSFIGIAQMAAAALLLIPRTATLGALLYFPIILNITLLSLAVRFEGSLLTAPLMVLANLYLICWDYDKLKYVLPFKHAAGPPPIPGDLPGQQRRDNKFALLFFAGVGLTILTFGLVITHVFDVLPRNTIADCRRQFQGGRRTQAGYEFCDCIHQRGQALDKSLDQYHQAPDDAGGKP